MAKLTTEYTTIINAGINTVCVIRDIARNQETPGRFVPKTDYQQHHTTCYHATISGSMRPVGAGGRQP